MMSDLTNADFCTPLPTGRGGNTCTLYNPRLNLQNARLA